MAAHGQTGAVKEERLLVDEREVVLTTALHVACDGGAGLLGHPLEYMTLEKGGQVICGYCGRRYLHMPSPAADEARSHGTSFVA